MKLLFSSMRNEGPQILEWIAYHIAIGFDEIMIATNDCDDGSRELIEALSLVAPVHHLNNDDLEGKNPQQSAYAKLTRTEQFAQAKYLMILDADEFLNIHVKTKHLNALLPHLEDQDIMTINWACFGPDKETTWSQDWVTQRFTQRLPNTAVPSGTFKSLIANPNAFSGFKSHGPMRKKDGSDIKIKRDYGAVEILEYDNYHHSKLRRNNADFVCYELAQVNHYMTKSMPEYRLRIARGRGATPSKGDFKQRHDLRYFLDRTKNTLEDKTIFPALLGAKKRAAELLKNIEISEAYQHCLNLHKKRIKSAERSWDAHKYKI